MYLESHFFHRTFHDKWHHDQFAGPHSLASFGLFITTGPPKGPFPSTTGQKSVHCITGFRFSHHDLCICYLPAWSLQSRNQLYALKKPLLIAQNVVVQLLNNRTWAYHKDTLNIVSSSRFLSSYSKPTIGLAPIAFSPLMTVNNQWQLTLHWNNEIVDQ